jgi:hypothetical protein
MMLLCLLLSATFVYSQSGNLPEKQQKFTVERGEIHFECNSLGNNTCILAPDWDANDWRSVPWSVTFIPLKNAVSVTLAISKGHGDYDPVYEEPCPVEVDNARNYYPKLNTDLYILKPEEFIPNLYHPGNYLLKPGKYSFYMITETSDGERIMKSVAFRLTYKYEDDYLHIWDGIEDDYLSAEKLRLEEESKLIKQIEQNVYTVLEDAKLEAFDMLGRKVSDNGDLRSLSNAMYILRAVSEKKVEIKRVVKQ